MINEINLNQKNKIKVLASSNEINEKLVKNLTNF